MSPIDKLKLIVDTSFMNRKKILIIEDDVYIKDVYEEILKENGFEVETAIDGEEGLVKIQEGGYSLILLDIMMPKMDGVELLKILKERPAIESNGPIVLLTNLAHDPVITQGLELGAKHYLIKSDLNPDQLVENVKEFVKEQ